MKRALRAHRLRAALALVAVGAAPLAAVSASAHAASHPSSHSPNACATTFHGRARVGHFGGIVRAVHIRAAGCQVHNTSDAANGTPPLIFHGGPVMGTRATGPVVVTPIFWNPAGHPMDSAYKKIITTYLSDVAAASGQHS